MRSASRTLERDRPGFRFSSALRAEITAWVAEQRERERGAWWCDLSRAIGVSEETLKRWAAPRASAVAAMLPVEVVDAPPQGTGTRIVRRAVTHPMDLAVPAKQDVAVYSFRGVSPGEYELIFKYGGYVVSREKVVLTNDVTSWTSHLRLSPYPQIPICA